MKSFSVYKIRHVPKHVTSYKDLYFNCSFNYVTETYRSRMRRDLPRLIDEEILDVDQVEKKLVAELGNNVCVYERICAKYADTSLQKRGRQHELDWDVVFR